MRQQPIFLVIGADGAILGADTSLADAHYVAESAVGESRVFVDATSDLALEEAARDFDEQNGDRTSNEGEGRPLPGRSMGQFVERSVQAAIDSSLFPADGSFDRWASGERGPGDLSDEECAKIAGAYFAPLVARVDVEIADAPKDLVGMRNLLARAPQRPVTYWDFPRKGEKGNKEERVIHREVVAPVVDAFPRGVPPEFALGKFDDLALAMFGQNGKLAKGDSTFEINGLSLLPAFKAKQYVAHYPESVGITSLDARRKARHADVRARLPKLNLCIGSSKQCRATCLIDSGNNNVTELLATIRNGSMSYQLARKVAWTALAIWEPEVFARLMHRALEVISKGGLAAAKEKQWKDKPVKKKGKKKAVQAIRLNVFQDIPWERIAPSMIRKFQKDIIFYDYTKVPGRRPLDAGLRYHLTFSLSESNEAAAAWELEHGRNVAVVFYMYRIDSKGDENKIVQQKQWLPTSWTIAGKSYGVINGNVDDARFFDPNAPLGERKGGAPVIVGLNYKLPMAGYSDPAQKADFDRRRKETEASALQPGGFLSGVRVSPTGEVLSHPTKTQKSKEERRFDSSIIAMGIHDMRTGRILTSITPRHVSEDGLNPADA